MSRPYSQAEAEARIEALKSALRTIANAESGYWGRIAHQALTEDERWHPLGDPEAKR